MVDQIEVTVNPELNSAIVVLTERQLKYNKIAKITGSIALVWLVIYISFVIATGSSISNQSNYPYGKYIYNDQNI